MEPRSLRGRPRAIRRIACPARTRKGNYFSVRGAPAFSRLSIRRRCRGGLGIHVTLDLAAACGLVLTCSGSTVRLRRSIPNGPRRSIRPSGPTGRALRTACCSGLRRYSTEAEPARRAAADFVIDTPSDHGCRGSCTCSGSSLPVDASLSIAQEVVAKLVEGMIFLDHCPRQARLRCSAEKAPRLRYHRFTVLKLSRGSTNAIHRFYNPPTIGKPTGYTHVVEATSPADHLHCGPAWPRRRQQELSVRRAISAPKGRSRPSSTSECSGRGRRRASSIVVS